MLGGAAVISEGWVSGRALLLILLIGNILQIPAHTPPLQPASLLLQLTRLLSEARLVGERPCRLSIPDGQSLYLGATFLNAVTTCFLSSLWGSCLVFPLHQFRLCHEIMVGRFSSYLSNLLAATEGWASPKL